MKQIKVKNLDQLYSTMKSEMGKLVADGYDCIHNQAPTINGANTLLQWFFKNIGSLKRGVNDVRIATATGEGRYTVYRDSLSVSSEPTTMGLLISLKRYEHNYCWNSYDQTSELDEKYVTQVFLLEME